MTLNSLLNSIGLIGINDNLVNWAGCGPSIYRANALTIKNYPFLFCSPTGTHRVDENWTTYAVSIFYVSRLLEDNSNEMDIQSTAIEVLKNIIRKIRNLDGVTDVSEEYSINVFVEYEKFADRCTGAYATVEISVVNDTICAIDDVVNHYFVFYNKDWDVIPATATSYEISWDTDYTEIQFQLISPDGETSYGQTSDNSVIVFLPENEEKMDKEYVFIARTDGVEGPIGTLHFSQRAIDYFDFITEDNATVKANTTAYTVQWATNYEGVRTWDVTRTSTGGEVVSSSGFTNGNSVTIPMSVNDWRDTSYSYEMKVYVNGTQRGVLHWTQDNPMFNILLGKYENLPANSTSCTVTWETTYNVLMWELHRLGETVTGVVTGTTYTFTFPANTGDTEIGMRLSFTDPHEQPLNESCEWWQKPAGSDFPYIEITSAPQSISEEEQSVCFGWRTNCDGNVRCDIYSAATLNENWNLIRSEVTSSLTGDCITFGANPNFDSRYLRLSVNASNADSPETYVAFETVHFTQSGGYFRITSADNQVLPATATSFTINYETNIEPPIPYAYTSPFGTSTGNSLNQTHLTINFRVNTFDTRAERYVSIGGQMIHWYQEAVSEIPFDPYRTIMDNPASNQIFYKTSDGQMIAVRDNIPKDANGNIMSPVSHTYGNYGIITYPNPIYSGGIPFKSREYGDLVEIVFPEGMVSVYSYDMPKDDFGTRGKLASVTFPSTLQRMEVGCFQCSPINVLILPASINHMAGMDFVWKENMVIYYEGTMAQWESMHYRSDKWLFKWTSNGTAPATGVVIHCSDGNITT